MTYAIVRWQKAKKCVSDDTFAFCLQICGCCTRRLRSSEFWLSLITLFMVLFFEASRAPFELFNFHHILTTWSGVGPIAPPAQFPDTEVYKAVMKWAVYAPALLHPLLYFTFSPEARYLQKLPHNTQIYGDGHNGSCNDHEG